MNTESAVNSYISAVAELGKTWDRIDLSGCMQMYQTDCNGLERHRDLILVVDQPDGWIRDKMWQPGYDIFGYNSSYWDRLVPAHVPNYLFFNTACVMSAGSYPSCFTDCDIALGRDPLAPEGDPTADSYSFFRHLHTSDDNTVPILSPGSDKLTPRYCLADPLESNCYVGLSTAFLFAVTLSVLVKSSIASLVIVILKRRSYSPLVTVGDAIASFIEKPDTNTIGLSCFDISKNLVFVGPRKWQVSNKRRWVAVPFTIWVTSYLLFAISIAICVYFLVSLYSWWHDPEKLL